MNLACSFAELVGPAGADPGDDHRVWGDPAGLLQAPGGQQLGLLGRGRRPLPNQAGRWGIL